MSAEEAQAAFHAFVEKERLKTREALRPGLEAMTKEESA